MAKDEDGRGGTWKALKQRWSGRTADRGSASELSLIHI